jgi:type II secretory pathway pseudopilin PulG
VNFYFSNKIKILLSSLIAAVILLLAVVWGVANGKKIAQAKILIQTSQNAISALQYFYQDQNRYPTATEFENQNLMLTYFSNFPPPDYPSSNCSQSYVYKRPDPAIFTLSFCLPTVEGGFKVGWNTINGSPSDTPK